MLAHNLPNGKIQIDEQIFNDDINPDGAKADSYEIISASYQVNVDHR
jgi:hypothetical protein